MAWKSMAVVVVVLKGSPAAFGGGGIITKGRWLQLDFGGGYIIVDSSSA